MFEHYSDKLHVTAGKVEVLISESSTDAIKNQPYRKYFHQLYDNKFSPILVVSNNRIIYHNLAFLDLMDQSEEYSYEGRLISQIGPELEKELTFFVSSEADEKTVRLQINEQMYEAGFHYNHFWKRKFIEIEFIPKISKADNSIEKDGQSALGRLINDMLSCEKENDVFMLLLEHVKAISSLVGVVISEVTPNRDLKPFLDYYRGNLKSNMEALAGFDFENVSLSISDEAYNVFSSGLVSEGPVSFYELVFRSIPKKVANTIDGLLQLKKVYVAGFVFDNKLSFTMTMMFGRNILIKNKQSIDAVIKIAEMQLLRIRERKAPAFAMKKYIGIAQSSPSPIAITDSNEKLIYVNPEFCKFLGYTKNELEGKNIRQFTDRVEFSNFQVNTHLRKKGHSGSYESKLIDKEGKVRRVLISASPIFNQHDQLWGSLGILTDLTPFYDKITNHDNVDLQCDNCEYRKYYNQVFHNSLDAVIIIDRNTDEILDINDAAVQLFNYNRDQLVGSPYSFLFHLENRLNPAYQQNFLDNMISEQCDSMECFVLNSRNEQIPILLYPKYEIIDGKSLIFFVIRDIAKVKNLQEKLNDITDKMSYLHKQRSLLLEDVSYKLRTPLNAIIGFSELLTNPVLNEEKRIEYSQILRDNGNVLLSYIQNMVETTPELEENNAEVFDLSALLTDVVNDLASDLDFFEEAKRLVLSLPDVSAMVRADVSKLKASIRDICLAGLYAEPSAKIELGYNVFFKGNVRVYFKIRPMPASIKDYFLEQQNFINERYLKEAEDDEAIAYLDKARIRLRNIGYELDISAYAGEKTSIAFQMSGLKNSHIKEPIIAPFSAPELKGIRILVVDPKRQVYDRAKEILANTDIRADYAVNASDALSLIRENTYHVVLANWIQADISGKVLVGLIKKELPNSPIFVVCDQLVFEEEKKLILQNEYYMTLPLTETIFFHKIKKSLQR